MSGVVLVMWSIVCAHAAGVCILIVHVWSTTEALSANIVLVSNTHTYLC